MLYYLWWCGVVIYQIYLCSFFDVNGDGVGDLLGIIECLDYIVVLGVDVIWILLFFKFFMVDFGYDIVDYCDVDLLFGSLDDFDCLLVKVYGLGLKVMIDQVLSYILIEYVWFCESCQDCSNLKVDWYVWVDLCEDGILFNNWLLLFGGCVWQWELCCEQYYLYNFLVDQLDLNFYYLDVQQVILDNVCFWFDCGVDGFCLDVINFCFYDVQLCDNLFKLVEKWVGCGFSLDNLYVYQYYYYNNIQLENLLFLECLCVLLDEYLGVVSLGEIFLEDLLVIIVEYICDGCLYMGYSFELLVDDYSVVYICDMVLWLEVVMIEGWLCWVVFNYDVEWVVSCWGGYLVDLCLVWMLVVMLCLLCGLVCLYQGEELGLVEVEVLFEVLQDLYGIIFWLNFKGCDGCCMLLLWIDVLLVGFIIGQFWLLILVEYCVVVVVVQECDLYLVLVVFCVFLVWWYIQLVFLYGSIRFFESVEFVLLFECMFVDEIFLLVFNLLVEVVIYLLLLGNWQQVVVLGLDVGMVQGNEFQLLLCVVYCV